MHLELTKEQFLELMKLVFLGEFIVNGHKLVPDAELVSQNLKDYIIHKAVENNIMEYLDTFPWERGEEYDFSSEKSSEFYELISDYCDEEFHTELVEIVAQNIIHQTLDQDIIEKMSPAEYDEIFERTTTIVDKEFQKNDYDNLMIKTGK